MKGLTSDQFKEIVDFAQKHHSFAKWISNEELEEVRKEFPKMKEFGFNIKYIESSYDSRDSTFWSVKFRSFGKSIIFSTNHFNTLNPEPKGFSFNNLYDWIMAYLKCEWNNKTIIKKMYKK